MDQARRTYLQRRLKGWETNLSLWLTDLLAQLHKVSPRKSRLCNWLDTQLNRLAQYVMGIVLIHTTLRVELGAPRVCYDPRRAHDMRNPRGCFGGELRRVFKAKSFTGRAAKIRWALDNLETLITRMARRLRKGLSRGASSHSRVAIMRNVAIFATPRGFAIDGADTS